MSIKEDLEAYAKLVEWEEIDGRMELGADNIIKAMRLKKAVIKGFDGMSADNLLLSLKLSDATQTVDSRNHRIKELEQWIHDAASYQGHNDYEDARELLGQSVWERCHPEGK